MTNLSPTVIDWAVFYVTTNTV